ncbi:MAG: PDZ domain-containing protein [Planctomycetes bacterium]|nr:PDZ domain-containing protein [Planctomycetota bacterium]
MREKAFTPLEKLIRLDAKAFAGKAKIHYSQARYLMLYLQRRGKLRKWYELYKASYSEDRTGGTSLEKVLKAPLGRIEEDWRKWIEQLRLPWGELRSLESRLGLEFRDTAHGVKVVRLVPGGAAEKAGRIRPGDRITKFGDKPIHNSAELAAAIRSAGANRTVTVELIRQGRKIIVRQPLAAAKNPPSTGGPLR